MEASSYAYDGDTSDSDDDDLVMFKNKVKHLEPKHKALDNPGSDADEEESEGDDEESGGEDVEDEDESEEASDDEEDDQPRNIVSMTDAKKSQLSKIQQQLAAAEDDDDSNEESDNDDDDKNMNLDSKKVETKNDQENDSDSELESSAGEEEENPSGKRKGSPLESRSKESSKKLKIDEEKQDVQRNRFKAKLSKMSIEEIHRLKNKLGLKLFNQKMSGKSSEAKNQEDFKRDNKNRPREMSSKKQVARFREIVVASKIEKRDPRFDPNCGEFDDKLFKENYKFVNEYKSSDLKFLKKQLQEEDDPEQIKKLKYLKQRTENQLRQIENDKKKDEEKKAENEERREQLKAGIKPQYISKSKQKERDLMKKYETLKESGGLDKYISKKTKKNLSKDRKRMDKL